MENTYRAIARNIKHYLERQNMTQDQLAQRLGVSNQAVSYWCSGKRAPRLDKIDRMCEIFKCKRSDLISNVTGTFVTKDGEQIQIGFKVDIPDPPQGWEKTAHNPKTDDYMSNVEIKDSIKVPTVEDFLLEYQFYTLLKKLNTKGQKKVYQFALDLTKDPTYQSEELINETKEMFQKYIKAGLIAEVKEAGSDDN